MPIRTQMLDSGNFVYASDLPPNSAFEEYLEFANRMMRQWREAQEACELSPFSDDLRRRKIQADELFKNFVEAFGPRFSLRPVRQEPMFVPLSRFLQQQYPIQDPFSILHCELEIPLHTVHDFPDHNALAQVNAALGEDTAFPWWQRGPHGQPCYLFGKSVWELKSSEAEQSPEGIILSFLELSDKHCQANGRVSRSATIVRAKSSENYIPEQLRRDVWRRTGGKCSKCRGWESLDFDYVTPPRPGTEPTPDNIELLCNSCYRKKHGLD